MCIYIYIYVYMYMYIYIYIYIYTLYLCKKGLLDVGAGAALPAGAPDPVLRGKQTDNNNKTEHLVNYVDIY